MERLPRFSRLQQCRNGGRFRSADGMFTLQQSECLGACADSPVMLVNDTTMCSFMSNEKLDQLVDGLRAAMPAATTTKGV